MIQRLLLFILLLISLLGCSTKENTARSRFWQGFTAHYNTYYNGNVAYNEGCEQQEENNEDHYHHRLPVFLIGNTMTQHVGNSQFEVAITKAKKAIQLHSIRKKPRRSLTKRLSEKERQFLQRKEFNPFLKNAWLLMGKAQFHQGHFLEAASTFSYISRLYAAEPEVVHTAQVWLARCYAQIDWFYDAEQALTSLDSLQLQRHKKLQRIYNVTKADLLLRRGRYDEALPYLRAYVSKAPTQLQKARLYYIIAQVEQQLNHPQAAYKALQRCLRKSPPYSMAISARIMQTEVLAQQQHQKKMIHQLKRMIRNDKNKDYLDQLYYALGNVYLSLHDTLTAIQTYETGLKKSQSQRIEKAILALRLADIYWQKGRYNKAQRCYNQALGMLDKEYPDYERITQRSAVLDQLVPYTNTIFREDSLQHLASLSTNERNRIIDEAIAHYKEQKKAEEKERRKAEALQQNDNFDFDNGDFEIERPKPQNRQQSGDKNWYFYNPSLLQNGKREFQRLWGKRKNEDDWRRKNKTIVNLQQNMGEIDYARLDSIEAANDSIEQLQQNEPTALPDEDNPLKRAYYMHAIPFTNAQRITSDSLIANALYHAGIIEKDDLEDFSLAAKTFERLVTQYPNFPEIAEAYYQMFLLYSRWGKHTLANNAKQWLSAHYPQHAKTLRIHSPLFMQKGLIGEHIEDSLYTATYDAYRKHDVKSVKNNFARSTHDFPDGINRPKFIFIHALSRVGQEKSSVIEKELLDLVRKYPKSDVAAPAGVIVNGLRSGRKIGSGYYDIGSLWTRRTQAADSVTHKQNNEPLTAPRHAPYVFMIAYPKGSINDNALLYAIAHFQFSGFYLRSFEIEKTEVDMLPLDKKDTKADNANHKNSILTEYRIYGFESYDEVHRYAQEAYADSTLARILKQTKVILISEHNLKLVPKVYSFAQYDEFFAKHYSPMKISHQLPLDRNIADTLTQYENIPAVIYPLTKSHVNSDSLQLKSHIVIPAKPINPLLPKKEKIDTTTGYPINEDPVSKKKEPTTTSIPVDPQNTTTEEDDTGGWYPIS